MGKHKLLNIIVLACVVASLLMTGGGSVLAQPQHLTGRAPSVQEGSIGTGSLDPTGVIDVTGELSSPAAPISPTDATKVPHYFGPWPNWANSPYTLPDATVTISGDGTGATAVATVGANGTITDLALTNPGSGYTAATVAITGKGSGASATADVTLSGVVTSIDVTAAGAGYTAPTVTIGATVSGGGAGAQATAYGGVEKTISIVSGGSNYTAPTVEFDMPDDPNGTIAQAHAVLGAGGSIAQIVVDDPGSGYAAAPNVRVYNGTLLDPIACGAAAGAAARIETMRAQKDKGRFETGSVSIAASPDAPVSRMASAADCGAVAETTLSVQSVVLTAYGSNYSAAPDVAISDASGTGAGATAKANVDSGGVTAVHLTAGGTGYITGGGIKKFVDPLPGLCNPAVAGSCTGNKYIPLGVADTSSYAGADTYQIGVVQYRTSFSSSLPDTLVRGYVQLDKGCTAPGSTGSVPGSQCYPLTNAKLDPNATPDPVLINGVQAYGVTPPQWLGPTLLASKDKPVRIVFYNLLPKDAGGDLFLPVDSSLMGSGMGPMAMAMPTDNGSVMDGVRNPTCTDYPQSVDSMGMGVCFKQDRATLHLHGGTTPWISDGTAHQWITPAGENTTWPQGVSVASVPDMSGAGCDGATDGCMTFFYTNQQSARLLFYHDHAWGITRLNVYAGEAAGYVITDPTEQKLFGPTGPYAAMGEGIPLVVQDRTFVPQDTQMYDVDANGIVRGQTGFDATKIASYGQDPTWDKARWGGYGNFWYHHVYMPAQNPSDPSGMSAYGRWMYGPYFWPPATPPYGPIANPYFDANCKIDDPKTWQYKTDPFCEPAQIPGTPNISVGMEQFNDTPIVNGVAYPTITLEPKAYRLRMLNAANDRFFNFQWYIADPNTASTSLNKKGEVIGGTEVAFKANELAAAQADPNVFPTPDTTVSLPGPDWVQIGTEGGFLPAPAVVDGQQVTTWITDPTRFDVGNVDLHSLLLAPAERADVIVDFSQFAGKTLILYNDAPAAFPARVASYDYYTGAPDLSPVGAPAILPGYGPNTRTVMQVKIAGTAAAPFNLTALQNQFKHKADGSGVFESGQHPIIVGQAAYNSAYGKNYVSSGWCNSPTTPASRCDGYVRVSDYVSTTFNTLAGPSVKTTMPLQPKAIHDEMNSTTFDEYGRMQANLGIEAQPPTPGLQNVTLYPFVNPATELIDATNLPKGDIDVRPMGVKGDDGTQLWRITHNGVDTHPIHWHLYDVQVVNRVTWDNIIIPPDPSELGWKDTVRISPLEDTIVALRPIIPTLPFEIPNAIRDLNPMMAEGSQAMFNNIDPQGNPVVTPIANQLVNFGWEYVYHCHILSHEEMDMMRPVSVVLPPVAPSGLAFSFSGTGPARRIVVSFTDNSITDTSFALERSTDGTAWTQAATLAIPLDPDPATPGVQPNVKGVTRSITDPTADPNAAYLYRVVALNTIGYGNQFPTMTAKSTSAVAGVNPPTAPTTVVATLQPSTTTPGQGQILLSWLDTATSETGFVILRSSDGVNFTQIATAPARNNTGLANYMDTTIAAGTTAATYTYRVAATNIAGTSTFAQSNAVTVPALPAAPSNFTVTNGANVGITRSVVLTWTDNSTNETAFTVQRATNSAFTLGLNQSTVTASAGTGTRTITQTGLNRNTLYWYRIRAANGTIIASGWLNATPFPIRTNP